ncbi:uncharacterized protein LOC143667189 isoform X2 [Tamandua tetradactyla]|uniref:uncharacterized protein LOC143667189 isoform X2 n=1 Tax=Tamandua tetradactyla TaxID=48850 RepID=UPI004053D40B
MPHPTPARSHSKFKAGVSVGPESECEGWSVLATQKHEVDIVWKQWDQACVAEDLASVIPSSYSMVILSWTECENASPKPDTAQNTATVCMLGWLWKMQGPLWTGPESECEGWSVLATQKHEVDIVWKQWDQACVAEDLASVIPSSYSMVILSWTECENASPKPDTAQNTATVCMLGWLWKMQGPLWTGPESECEGWSVLATQKHEVDIVWKQWDQACVAEDLASVIPSSYSMVILSWTECENASPKPDTAQNTATVCMLGWLWKMQGPLWTGPESECEGWSVLATQKHEVDIVWKQWDQACVAEDLASVIPSSYSMVILSWTECENASPKPDTAQNTATVCMLGWLWKMQGPLWTGLFPASSPPNSPSAPVARPG